MNENLKTENKKLLKINHFPSFFILFYQMNIGSASSRDSWIDFLALNGFSLETLYQNIISRVRGHP